MLQRECIMKNHAKAETRNAYSRVPSKWEVLIGWGGGVIGKFLKI